jgi:uncharacterized protein YkwD
MKYFILFLLYKYAYGFNSSSFNVKISQIPTAEEIQLYKLTKQLRRQGFTCPDGTKFPPNPNTFAYDCRIGLAAHNYAQYMGDNNFFGHIDKNGKSPCDRTTATGLSACGENIAAGQNSPQAAIDAWKGSKNHCPNMMDPKVNRIGLGYYYAPSSTYKYYWVQNMGTDNYRTDISCNPPDASDANNLPIAPSCRDNNEQGCKAYQGYAGSQYCNQGWASTECKKTCGICSDTSQPQQSQCVDLDLVNCKAYNGYAGSQYCGPSYGNGWAYNNCKKTCKLC